MEDVLRLRFAERDKVFAQSLTALKSEMSARGMFHSGGTVKRGHDILAQELVDSRKVIVKTIRDHLLISKPTNVDAALSGKAQAWLSDRKDSLEKQYHSHMQPIISSLSNKPMISSYLTLNESMDVNSKELQIEVAHEIESYIMSRGGTLYERIKNQFLNRPLVVIGVITCASITAILSFLRLVGVL